MIDYNNKIFRSLNTSKNGEVNSDTVFYYRQNKNIVTAIYSGGNILSGQLIAIADANGVLNMHYHHINSSNEPKSGKCISTPEILENGKIRLLEKWQWTSGDNSTGESVVEEI